MTSVDGVVRFDRGDDDDGSDDVVVSDVVGIEDFELDVDDVVVTLANGVVVATKVSVVEPTVSLLVISMAVVVSGTITDVSIVDSFPTCPPWADCGSVEFRNVSVMLSQLTGHDGLSQDRQPFIDKFFRTQNSLHTAS